MHAPTPPELTPRQLRNRRLRNIAIGSAVAALAILFYVITIVKVGPGVFRAEP
jgi:hypothetical protein